MLPVTYSHKTSACVYVRTIVKLVLLYGQKKAPLKGALMYNDQRLFCFFLFVTTVAVIVA